jgi:hypothetical protein
MEPLTINQELYNLSLADLCVLEAKAQLMWDINKGEREKTFLNLIKAEIGQRIDLIKSKI